MKLNRFLSFGIKLNSLFGNQMKLNSMMISEYTSTYQDSSDYIYTDSGSILQIIFNQYTGYSVEFDLMFELDSHQFAASSTVMGPIDVLHRIYYNLVEPSNFLLFDSDSHLLQYDPYHSIDINDNVDAESFFLDRINDYSLGYHYNLSTKGVIIEYHKKN